MLGTVHARSLIDVFESSTREGSGIAADSMSYRVYAVPSSLGRSIQVGFIAGFRLACRTGLQEGIG